MGIVFGTRRRYGHDQGDFTNSETSNVLHPLLLVHTLTDETTGQRRHA